MPPESASDTLSAEALVVQVIEENQEAAKRYAGGDMSALGSLQERATKLAAGRIPESTLKDTLMCKLGASI